MDYATVPQFLLPIVSRGTEDREKEGRVAKKGSARRRAAGSSGTARASSTRRATTPGRATSSERKPRAAKPAGARAASKPSRKSPAPARRAAAAKSARPGAPAIRLTRKLADRLLHLEDALEHRIVGKSEAVERVARVVRVRLSQLEMRPERPRGMFFIFGPSGVGKSEFAFAVAEALYGRDDAVVSIDLDELEQEDDLARVGSTIVHTPESVLVEGLLTTPVRENPQVVLLLRGLERAHPAFQRILLQILERGVLEDALGPVSFHQTIIFVTSSFRRDELPPAGIGFARASRNPQEVLRERLERLFMPDLLGAFDEIIELPILSGVDVRRIARYKVSKVLARMHARRQAIEVADEVFEGLIPDELCRREGAGFLNRTLEDRLFNPLARYLLEHPRPQPLKVALEGGKVIIREAQTGKSRPK